MPFAGWMGRVIMLFPLTALGGVGAQDSTRARAVGAVHVIADSAALRRVPGSGSIVERQQLLRQRPLSTHEALRAVSGVHVREEEGWALRPNIGIRGLNPTRSAKVLLLEDGVPFTLAPYGDNASYYHPPIDRFQRIEVLKGAGQILFGPQTVGGVINYVTPDAPTRGEGRVSMTGGNRGYLNAHAMAGGRWGGMGVRADVTRKQGELARDNTGAELTDATVKGTVLLGGRQTLTLKANGYQERSRQTYSGLTEAEWRAAPLQNLFRNDSMRLDRFGASAVHRMEAGRAALTTTAYGYTVRRDWWRQSSSSAQRPNDASDPACGGMANLLTTCGNEGRLRSYHVYGVEPRLRLEHALGGLAATLETGVRAHVERQHRRQVNGATPNAREVGVGPNAGLREYNVRDNVAFAAFVQEQLQRGALTVTPGVRVEHVTYARENRLPSAPVAGDARVTQLVPGLGATWQRGRGTTWFAGVHRGFAPQRTEDLIDNATGTVVELDPELSWNAEVGARFAGARWSAEATLFQMDFDNQVIPASVAGGTGAALTSAGRTRHQGVELEGRGTLWSRGAHRVEGSLALTWLPVARFEGARYAYVGRAATDVPGKVYAAQNPAATRERVSVSGNRLPYAPRELATVALGWVHRDGGDLRVELVHTGEQFADPVNTRVLVADGQQGAIPGVAVWHVAAGWPVRPLGVSLFAAVKNVGDRRFVVDRSRGLLPGAPRLLQAGVRTGF